MKGESYRIKNAQSSAWPGRLSYLMKSEMGNVKSELTISKARGSTLLVRLSIVILFSLSDCLILRK